MGKRMISLVTVVLLFVFAGSASALSGAIFTTLEDGSRVNHNIYEDLEDVYLDGGPGQNAPSSAAGLPEGYYYFQVTDPSGKTLLSSDPVKCREFHVNSYGVIDEVVIAVCSKKVKGKITNADCTHNTGIDQDHSDVGAITVQLWPYDRTPNKGGVYKAWVTSVDDFSGDPELVDSGYSPGNYHGFIPRFSKTDNFKVRRGKPFDPPIIEVRKFHDLNADGSRDPGEPEIPGWQIEITDPLGVVNTYYTPVEIQAMPAGTWTVEEETPDHWLQTALYLDYIAQTVSPDVQVQIAGTSEESHIVVFGNVQTGDIIGCKFYDRNADGVWDFGEPPIPGWLITLNGTAVNGTLVDRSGYTDESGCVTFADLLPGNYTISEVIPSTDWFGSTPTSFEIDLLGGAVEAREFGNFCVGSADFNTKGYWHNKNGLGEIDQDDIDYVNTLDPYDSPSSYFGAGDEPFDGVFTDGTEVDPAYNNDKVADGVSAGQGTPKAEVSHFLVDSNAGGDPREQLAQQLLAFIFNCIHRLDSPGATIQLPDGTWVIASDLINEAISAWAGTNSAEQTAIKNVLDTLNNNNAVPFISYNPCPVVYP
jgi:hypothetical protein